MSQNEQDVRSIYCESACCGVDCLRCKNSPYGACPIRQFVPCQPVLTGADRLHLKVAGSSGWGVTTMSVRQYYHYYRFSQGRKSVLPEKCECSGRTEIYQAKGQAVYPITWYNLVKVAHKA